MNKKVITFMFSTYFNNIDVYMLKYSLWLVHIVSLGYPSPLLLISIVVWSEDFFSLFFFYIWVLCYKVCVQRKNFFTSIYYLSLKLIITGWCQYVECDQCKERWFDIWRESDATGGCCRYWTFLIFFCFCCFYIQCILML